LTAFGYTTEHSAPPHSRRIVENLELVGPTFSIELEHPPRSHNFTLQYVAPPRPCLFKAAIDFTGGRTIRLRDGSPLPAGRVDVAYLTDD
jgi:hypothetical protein